VAPTAPKRVPSARAGIALGGLQRALTRIMRADSFAPRRVQPGRSELDMVALRFNARAANDHSGQTHRNS